MIIPVSINVRKHPRKKDKYIVDFCKCQYFCGSVDDVVMSKSIREVILFNTHYDANNFALRELYKMDIYPDKFKFTLNIWRNSE